MYSSLFLSHGSPMMIVSDTPARRFLEGLGQRLGRPSAVVAVSAHDTAPQPLVGGAARPKTIHDFYGFPEALYRISYPAPGAPALAERVAALLGGQVDAEQGLDHGIWSVMSLLWPQADIPVVPVTVQPQLGPDHHYRLGQALRPLIAEGVLVIGTGATTHNLRAYMSSRGEVTAPAAPWVTDFTEWLADASAEGDVESLLDYRARAPHAVDNHPTDEHLLPFFAALGAAPRGRAERLHASVEYGVLAMDNYGFA